MEERKMDFKRSFGKDRHSWDLDEKQKVPFCKQIREFINESRKCQTLYANFEGSYDRRIVKHDDLTELETVVFLTLSNSKDHASLTPTETDQVEQHKDMILKKICSSSRKYNLGDEIHYYIVWIYYFDYSEIKIRSVPIFKVFKTQWSSEALYIDTNCIQYDNWDSFINTCQLPASFICIPRQGNYTFISIDGEELLDLEYICKNSQFRRHSGQSYQTYGMNMRPFSQISVREVLAKAARFARLLLGNYNLMAYELEGFGVIVPLWIKVILCGIAICLRVIELMSIGNDPEESFKSSAPNFNLMLLNNNGGEETNLCMKFKEVFKANLQKERIEHPMQDKSLSNFLKLLIRDNINPSEKVMEILKYAPEIAGFVEICYFVCAAITQTDFFNADLHAWISLFEFISGVTSSLKGEKKMKAIEPKQAEKSFYDLEKVSSSRIVSELNASPGLAYDKLDLEKTGLKLGDLRVYVSLNTTPDACAALVGKLLKSNYSLQKETYFQSIIHDRKTIGYIIPFSILSCNHAIIVLRDGYLEEGNNKKESSTVDTH